MRRDALDIYDLKPSGMLAYLRHNGYHFNRKMCEFAVSLMRCRNATTGKQERVEMWTKEQVDKLLESANVTLDSTADYDYVYVANMAKADFYKSSLPTEQMVALYINDVMNDCDQSDGFIFNRFYADCTRCGVGIPWSDLL